MNIIKFIKSLLPQYSEWTPIFIYAHKSKDIIVFARKNIKTNELQFSSQSVKFKSDYTTYIKYNLFDPKQQLNRILDIKTHKTTYNPNTQEYGC